jgi:DNA invertase Pin-like site-specific DNA recombinase
MSWQFTGRSLQHLAQLIGEFEAHSTALVATSQGIDTSEVIPPVDLQMDVLAAVAEFERSVIRERSSARTRNDTRSRSDPPSAHGRSCKAESKRSVGP